jgi:hypothetical protein
LAASPDSAPVREYDFHLLRDPETVNAFALPGGQIFITVALLGRLGDARLYPNGHRGARPRRCRAIRGSEVEALSPTDQSDARIISPNTG